MNDLKFHPKNYDLIISASTDRSIRLWNAISGNNIATFAGEIHREQVLSISFDEQGDKFISGGADSFLAVWNFDDPKIKDLVDRNDLTVEPLRVFYPEFSTNLVHKNYIDSILWLGTNTFLSKSHIGDMVFWKIKDKDHQKEPKEIRCFEVEDCDLWFVRFAHWQKKILALGDKRGRIHVWSLDEKQIIEIEPEIIAHPKSKSLIRAIAFSNDGSIMITANELGEIMRYDRNDAQA